MHRFLIIAMFALSTVVWAQEPADDDATEPAANDAAEDSADAEEGLSEDELEDLDIDNQEDHLGRDNEDFESTDAIRYQQAIEYPVDI